MRNKRRKKHRKHREVDYEEFNKDIISRNKRETFNLDIKLRFKLCEDPNGDPLTPGMSENYVLPVLLPVIISHTESLVWVGPETEIKPKVIFITHHENYLGWFIKDIGGLTFESVSYESGSNDTAAHLALCVQWWTMKRQHSNCPTLLRQLWKWEKSIRSKLFIWTKWCWLYL